MTATARLLHMAKSWAHSLMVHRPLMTSRAKLSSYFQNVCFVSSPMAPMVTMGDKKA